MDDFLSRFISGDIKLEKLSREELISLRAQLDQEQMASRERFAQESAVIQAKLKALKRHRLRLYGVLAVLVVALLFLFVAVGFFVTEGFTQKTMVTSLTSAGLMILARLIDPDRNRLEA